MGSVMSLFSSKISKEDLELALTKAKEIVSSGPVIVFSKTYCGYCPRVKNLLTQLGASYKVIELDIEGKGAMNARVISCLVHFINHRFSFKLMQGDGSKIQSALLEWTGQRTVPNVFIGQKHIGGCDDVMEKHKAGQLVPLLRDAGAIA